MRYRDLGKTGMKVSEVGFGGEHVEGKPYSQVESTIHAALDHGINIMDIFMSNPQVRKDIGRALKGRRDKMIIQGQIGSAWIDNQYARIRDMDQCKRFYEDLLRYLDTDYMDIAMVHFVDTQSDFDKAFEVGLFDYAHQLKASGAARAVGVSSHDPIVAAQLIESGAIDVLMFSLNPAYDVMPATIDLEGLFDPENYKKQVNFTVAPERARLYRLAEEKGVGITVMKGLGAGKLLEAKSSPFGVSMTTNQLIHYALTRPGVASILLGCKTAQEIEQCVAYETATEDERDYSVVLKNAPRYKMDGQCMYCNHCLPCPMHIDIAQVNKYLDLAQQSGVLPTVQEHYQALENKAGDCIACKQCEPNCPFGVPITDRMEKAKEIFGA